MKIIYDRETDTFRSYAVAPGTLASCRQPPEMAVIATA